MPQTASSQEGHGHGHGHGLHMFKKRMSFNLQKVAALAHRHHHKDHDTHAKDEAKATAAAAPSVMVTPANHVQNQSHGHGQHHDGGDSKGSPPAPPYSESIPSLVPSLPPTREKYCTLRLTEDLAVSIGDAFEPNPKRNLDDAALFEYGNIRWPKFIRLLLVFSAESPEEPLESLLFHAELHEVPFQMLKYEPGDDTTYTHLNGMRAPVSVGLDEALRAIRDRAGKRPFTVLWVDELCVNQADRNECDVHGRLKRDIVAACTGKTAVDSAINANFKRRGRKSRSRRLADNNNNNNDNDAENDQPESSRHSSSTAVTHGTGRSSGRLRWNTRNRSSEDWSETTTAADASPAQDDDNDNDHDSNDNDNEEDDDDDDDSGGVSPRSGSRRARSIGASSMMTTERLRPESDEDDSQSDSQDDEDDPKGKRRAKPVRRLRYRSVSGREMSTERRPRTSISFDLPRHPKKNGDEDSQDDRSGGDDDDDDDDGDEKEKEKAKENKKESEVDVLEEKKHAQKEHANGKPYTVMKSQPLEA